MGTLADLAGGEAGEAGPVLHQAVQVRGGDELGVGLAVHVHELREQELDPVVADVIADVVQRFGCGEVVIDHLAPETTP
jgi:hypothetical protein